MIKAYMKCLSSKDSILFHGFTENVIIIWKEFHIKFNSNVFLKV